MAVRVGINGFGRIGRNVFRTAYERDADIEWVAVNDLANVETRRTPAEVRLVSTARSRDAVDHDRRRDHRRRQGGSRCSRSTIRPRCPWAALGADVVIESTGFFTSARTPAKHLDRRRHPVMISAPATDPDVRSSSG